MATPSDSDVPAGPTQTASHATPYNILDGDLGTAVTISPDESTVVPQTAAFILGFIVAFFVFMLLVLSCGGSQRVRRARLRWIRRIMGLPDPPDIPDPPQPSKADDQKLPERPIIWDVWIDEEKPVFSAPDTSDPWRAIEIPVSVTLIKELNELDHSIIDKQSSGPLPSPFSLATESRSPPPPSLLGRLLLSNSRQDPNPLPASSPPMTDASPHPNAMESELLATDFAVAEGIAQLSVMIAMPSPPRLKAITGYYDDNQPLKEHQIGIVTTRFHAEL